MIKNIFLLLVLGIQSISLSATEWHVAINGSAYDYATPYSNLKKGTGTIEHPWTLEFALDNPKDPTSAANTNWIKPGDVVWVHEGTYRGWKLHKSYTLSPRDTEGCHIKNCLHSLKAEFDVPRQYISNLEGDSLNPIIVRAWKDGKVTLDGEDLLDKLKYYECTYCAIKYKISGIYPQQVLLIKGKFTTFWGIEITISNSSHLNLYKSQKEFTIADSSTYFKDGGGILLQGKGLKLIDLVLYNITNCPVGDFSVNKMSEIQGCIFYNGGYSAPQRGSGHSIYTSNEDDSWKKYFHNIVFNQNGHGIHIFKTNRKTGVIRNYDVEYNICFNCGSIYESPLEKNRIYGYPNIYFGGHASRENCIVKYNHAYTFYSPLDSLKNTNVPNVEFHADIASDTIRKFTVENNYFIGGYPVFQVNNFRQSVVRNNTMFAASSYDHGNRYCNPFLYTYSDYFLENKTRDMPQVNAGKLGLTIDYNTYYYTLFDNDFITKRTIPVYFQYKNPDTATFKKRPVAAKAIGYDQWQKFGFDQHSSFKSFDKSATKQPIQQVFISDNDDASYNPGRKHIVIYNLLDKLGAQGNKLDLTPELKLIIPQGSEYVLRDVQNYHSEKQTLRGKFDATHPIYANMAPGQPVELPRMKDGSLSAGIKIPRNTCPEFAVFTIDFFPYDVEIKKENTSDGVIKITASVNGKGKYFKLEKFEYEWLNHEGTDKNKEQITVKEKNLKGILLKVTDMQTGISITKEL